MKPYYERDGITIYHADAYETVQMIAADTVITDPVWPGASIPLRGSDRALSLFEEVVSELPMRVKRIAVQLGCDTDPNMLRFCSPFKFFRVCWLKLAAPGHKGRLLYSGDVAYLYGPPPRSEPGRHLVPGEMTDSAGLGKESDHPCPRKLSHVRFLVKHWSDPEDIILDPFMGSGTTLLAAKELGHTAVGIEIEEKYCEMAAKRIESQGVIRFGEVSA